jgi:hypothetical protein
LSAVWLVLALAAFGGMIGGCEGTPRGVRRVVRESQFRTEVLEPAAKAVANGLFRVDEALRVASEARPSDDDSGAPAGAGETRLEAFERGEVELDVPAFFKRLETVEAVVAER